MLLQHAAELLVTNRPEPLGGLVDARLHRRSSRFCPSATAQSSGLGQSGNPGHLFRKPPGSFPSIVAALQPNPDPRPIATQLAEPDGHVRADGDLALGKPVKRL